MVWKIEIRNNDFNGKTRQAIRGLGDIKKDSVMMCLARENVCAVAYERGQLNTQRTTDFDEWSENPASKDVRVKNDE